MRTYPWTVQVNRDSLKDWSASAAAVKFVYGDTFLLAAKIEDFLYTTNAYAPKDFTLDGGNPQALRVVIRKEMNSTSYEYSFQASYNQGYLAGFGDLTTGQVEWLVALSDSQIKTDIDAAGGVLSCYLEISYTDGDGVPSTIAQVPITIVDQVDDGAAGTPPPSSPTYLTGTEIADGWFSKDKTMFWSVLSASTGTPPALTGGEDKYVIPATGTTGAWVGNEGKIAVDDGTWTYYIPSEGWGASVVDDTNVIQYISSAWAPYLVSGVPNLTTQYRGVFVSAAGVVTESSTITTNASGHLIAGTALFGGASLVGSEKLGVAGSIYATSQVMSSASGSFAMTAGLSVQSNIPTIYIKDTGSNANEKSWLIRTDGSKLSFQASSDDELTRVPFLEVDRTGTVIDEIVFPSAAPVLIGTAAQVGSETLGVAGDGYFSGTIIGKRETSLKTANYTATVADDTIECNGTFTVTLPALNGIAGTIVYVTNVGTGVITVDGNGTETIMGTTTRSLSAGDSLSLIANAAEDNWILRG